MYFMPIAFFINTAEERDEQVALFKISVNFFLISRKENPYIVTNVHNKIFLLSFFYFKDFLQWLLCCEIKDFSNKSKPFH